MESGDEYAARSTLGIAVIIKRAFLAPKHESIEFI
jgi:hypothetical protein